MRGQLQKVFIEYAPGREIGAPDKVSAKAFVRVGLKGTKTDILQVITGGYATVITDIARESRKNVESEQLCHLKQVLQALSIPTLRFTDLANNAEGRTL
jgi:hypothetical protein